MRIKPFRAVYPDFRYISSIDGFFARVKEDYPEFKHSGFFQKADQDAFYVYEISNKEKSYLGFICLAHAEDYLDGRIKIHEHTLASKEEQQTRLLLARAAQVKPVLLTYEDVPRLNQLLQELQIPKNLFYETTFEESGEVHSFWKVHKKKAIQQIEELVSSSIPKAYIADGHHRSIIMAHSYEQHRHQNPNPYSHFLVAFFSKSQLIVHDYNRVVEGLGDSTISNFVARISQICKITPLEEGKKPEKKHQMTLFVNKEWYQLEWRKPLLKKHKDDPVLLDTHLLDKYILDDILGIKDPKSDKRLKYVEGPAGIAGLQNKALKNENRIGFCLYPAKLEDMMVVADRGEVMPPKSTWFEPRIKNGLLVLELDLQKK